MHPPFRLAWGSCHCGAGCLLVLCAARRCGAGALHASGLVLGVCPRRLLCLACWSGERVWTHAAQRTVRRHFGLCSTDCLGRAHGSAPHPEALFPLLKFSTVGHPVSLLTWPCSESPPPSIAHGRLPRSLYCNACSMAVCPALRLLCVCVRCQLRSRTQAVCHCDH